MYIKNLTIGLTCLFTSIFVIFITVFLAIVGWNDIVLDMPKNAMYFVIPVFAFSIIIPSCLTIFPQDCSILYRVKIDQSGITLLFRKKIKHKYLWEDFINIEIGRLLQGGREFVFTVKKSHKTFRLEDRRKIRKAILNNCTNQKITNFISKL